MVILPVSILPQNDSENKLEAALQYLQKDWSVIPCHSIKNGRCTCGRADCDKPGKHSIIKWKEYQTRHATEEEVKKWWRRWPFANIGIVTGAISGLLVLDIDGTEGAEAVGDRHLPQTVFSETGGGGWHCFFEY
ncbi:MAG TPA: bifunctional DNA primase/polymerase, partial [Bacillota bacterium]|nr:bifunctional DNA primase/polymerase [Bacillota bacterium]